MRRVFAFAPLALALCSLPTSACKAKPSEKACKEAIENVRRINRQDTSDVGADPTAAIRSCRGNSSKETVECMRTAKTQEDVRRCEGEEGEKYFNEAQEALEKQEAKSGGGAAPATDAAPAAPEGTAPTEATPPSETAPPSEAAETEEPSQAEPKEASAPSEASAAKAVAPTAPAAKAEAASTGPVEAKSRPAAAPGKTE